MSTSGVNEDLRSGLRAILAARGQAGPWTWRAVAADARHEIWRLRAGAASLIVKVYRPGADRYYHHRWRREERALDLLSRQAPGLAPEPHGALLASDAFAAVAMEDLGSESLAQVLERADSDERASLLARAVEALAAFRDVASRHQGMLRALAYQSDLDRITRDTLRRRLAIAAVRLRDPLTAPEPDAAPRALAPGLPWRDLEAGIVRLLVRAPRRVVHNGFSPLNLMPRPDGRLAVIDWETLAAAAPALDAADLLTFPSFGLSANAIEDEAARLADASDAAGPIQVFWAAAAERSLTYAATAAVRERRAQAASQSDRASTYAARRRWYLGIFDDALERLHLDDAARRRIRDALAGHHG
ncbi:MAG: aminoglycoside phosphotransferase family protein [Chloroflexi bacterium]|nr:aminoglycoside phosphotransferase family protein [Chloroflexota bacterium]